jgi:hypothetical protein
MNCPKCGFAQDMNPRECPRCGVVFSKFLRVQEQPASPLMPSGSSSVPADIEGTLAEQDVLRRELRARMLALPCALLGAWLAVKTAPGLVRIFTMWIHETGHAVSAWLCGYTAWPGPWITPVGSERSILLSGMVVGLLAFGAFRAWQCRRWFWVAAATAVLLLTLCCTLFFSRGQARQLITFGGDGGCLVLGTALMLTVYARADHPLRSEGLRWALLVFGALAFMDAYLVWSGSFDRLPFGESERGLSDPSVLAEEFGWGVLLLVNRYIELARACFSVLLLAYVAGIAQFAIALRSAKTPSCQSEHESQDTDRKEYAPSRVSGDANPRTAKMSTR